MKALGTLLMGITMVIIVALIMSLPLWLLWNWLMPTVFGLAEVTLVQAFGLMLLSGILFRTSVAFNNTSS